MSDNIPLAERMRPKSLDSYLGQTHLVGVDSILKRAADNATLPSMIFWGPPGVGKTTLARILADKAKLPFHQFLQLIAG